MLVNSWLKPLDQEFLRLFKRRFYYSCFKQRQTDYILTKWNLVLFRVSLQQCFTKMMSLGGAKVDKQPTVIET